MPGVEGKRKAKGTTSSQAASPAKKVRLEKPDLKGKRRSQPVTAPAEEDEDEGSSAGEEELEELDEGEELDDEFQEGTSQPPKDPNGMYSLMCMPSYI